MNIPTAEELYFNQFGRKPTWDETFVIKEFAKLHVKAALVAAAENVDVTGETIVSFQEGSTLEIDKETILTAYPETLIK